VNQQIQAALAPPAAPDGFKRMLISGAPQVDDYLQPGGWRQFASATANMCSQPKSDMYRHFRQQLHPSTGLALLQNTHYTGILTIKPDGDLKLSRDFTLTRLGKIQVLTRSGGVVAREFVDWLATPAYDEAIASAAAMRAATITRKARVREHNTAFANTVAAATHANHPKRAAQRSSQDFQHALRHEDDKTAYGRSTKKEIIAANNGNPDLPEDHAFYNGKTANSLGTPEYLAKMCALEAEANAMRVQFGISFNEAKMTLIKQKGDTMLPRDLNGDVLSATQTRKRNFNQTFSATGIDSTMEPARARLVLAAPAPVQVPALALALAP